MSLGREASLLCLQPHACSMPGAAVAHAPNILLTYRGLSVEAGQVACQDYFPSASIQHVFSVHLTAAHLQEIWKVVDWGVVAERHASFKPEDVTSEGTSEEEKEAK